PAIASGCARSSGWCGRPAGSMATPSRLWRSVRPSSTGGGRAVHLLSRWCNGQSPFRNELVEIPPERDAPIGEAIPDEGPRTAEQPRRSCEAQRPSAHRGRRLLDLWLYVIHPLGLLAHHTTQDRDGAFQFLEAAVGRVDLFVQQATAGAGVGEGSADFRHVLMQPAELRLELADQQGQLGIIDRWQIIVHGNKSLWMKDRRG